MIITLKLALHAFVGIASKKKTGSQVWFSIDGTIERYLHDVRMLTVLVYLNFRRP